MSNATIGSLRVNLGLNSAEFQSALKKTQDQLGGFGRMAVAAFGAVAAAMSVRAIADYADQWSELNSRVRNAAGSMEAGTAVMGRLEAMARRTYSSLGQTAESWLSNATTLRALGYSTEQQLDLTESLNNAMVISATRGQRAESVMRAWSNAMALGELRGTNLNAVLTGSDRLAQALADSMGTSVDRLRALGAQGAITTDVMFGVTEQLERLRDEAEEMPATIGDGMTLLGNSMLAFVGRIDQALGASESFAGMLVAVADAISGMTGGFVVAANLLSMALAPALDLLGAHMELVGKAAGVAGVAILGAFGPAALGAITSLAAAVGGPLLAALRAVFVAMAANPMTMFTYGISAAVAAIFIFRDEIDEVFGVDIAGIVLDSANTLIGYMVGAVEAIKVAWRTLPDFFGTLGRLAWNNFIAEFERPLWAAPNGEVIIPGLDLSAFRADLSELEADVAAAMGDAFAGAQGVNYLDGVGEWLSSLRGGAGEAQDALEELGETANRVAGGSDDSAFGRLTKSIRDNVAALELEREVLGMTAAAAAAHRIEVQLLAAAAEDGRRITPELRMEIEALTDAYSSAHLALEGARLEMEMWGPWEAMRDRMAELDEMVRAGAISWDTYARAAVQANMTAMASTLGSVSQITSTLAGAFRDNKALAIANAVVNTAEGATKALAQGGFWGMAQAAAVVAAGAAQINTIMSAQPGVAAMPRAASMPRASAPAGQQRAQEQVVHRQDITLHGLDPEKLYEGENMIRIIKALARGKEDDWIVGDVSYAK